MTDSDFLRTHPYAQNDDALERVHLAMLRLPNILERETVACQKTLEQKISDQGPTHQRVDPHLLGLAIRELFQERKLLKAATHPATKNVKWFSNARTDEEEIQNKLEALAPLYGFVSTGDFTNMTGDALEIITHKSLASLNNANPRFAYFGSFDYSTKNKFGRYPRINVPPQIGSYGTTKLPDFYLCGFDTGSLLVECKNYREWIYPTHGVIRDLIIKALESRTTPVLVARRLHYTTITNLVAPAGIISHESYFQYYPADHACLAKKVSHKRSLGFSDVRATEDPHSRTIHFFCNNIPAIADKMISRFNSNRAHLARYVRDEINLAQLYNAIDSPAAGNWTDPDSAEIPF